MDIDALADTLTTVANNDLIAIADESDSGDAKKVTTAVLAAAFRTLAPFEINRLTARTATQIGDDDYIAFSDSGQQGTPTYKMLVSEFKKAIRASSGLPAGGSVGQIIRKSGAADGAAGWVDASTVVDPRIPVWGRLAGDQTDRGSTFPSGRFPSIPLSLLPDAAKRTYTGGTGINVAASPGSTTAYVISSSAAPGPGGTISISGSSPIVVTQPQPGVFSISANQSQLAGPPGPKGDKGDPGPAPSVSATRPSGANYTNVTIGSTSFQVNDGGRGPAGPAGSPGDEARSGGGPAVDKASRDPEVPDPLR